MEQKRKWLGPVLIAGLLVITAAALGFSSLSGNPQERTGQPSSAPPSAAPTVAPSAVPAGRTANASVIGYGGPVLVRLTLDDQNRIAALDVGGARFSETEGVGSRVKEEIFLRTFSGLTPPLVLNQDVDALSGATISSQAVVDAVNEAAAFLMGTDASSDTN